LYKHDYQFYRQAVFIHLAYPKIAYENDRANVDYDIQINIHIPFHQISIYSI